jgi:hypothetical protein
MYFIHMNKDNFDESSNLAGVEMELKWIDKKVLEKILPLKLYDILIRLDSKDFSFYLLSMKEIKP